MRPTRRAMRALNIFLVVVLAQGACHSVARRYIVSVTPIDVGLSPGLCVGVDPTDPQGVWWWEAGHDDCSSRSTGPGLFHPENATVAQVAGGGPMLVTFRLPTHSDSRPFVDVRLAVEAAEVRSIETGSRAPIEYRKVLDIPEAR
jgi:hypothetical protein